MRSSDSPWPIVQPLSALPGDAESAPRPSKTPSVSGIHGQGTSLLPPSSASRRLLKAVVLSEPPGLCWSSLDQTRSDVGGLVDSLAVDLIEEGGSQRGIKRALFVP